MRDKDWVGYRLDTTPPEPRNMVAPRLMGNGARLPGKVDLRADFPPVTDQARTASCAAHAVGAAMEYLMRKRGLSADLSYLFIYYNGRQMTGAEGRDSGMSTGAALASVMAHGACEDSLWPFEVDRVLMKPPGQCYAARLQFADLQYAQVLRGDPARQALANGWPVVFRFFGPREFMEEAHHTKRMPGWGGRPPAQQAFGHTMLAVGYDDDARDILVRNSWGEQYGERGYLRIPYDTLEAATNEWEFWSISPAAAGAVVTGAAGAGGAMRMEGATMAESVAYATSGRYRDDLERLGKDLRRELQDDVDDAKRAIRNRLRGLNDDR